MLKTSDKDRLLKTNKSSDKKGNRLLEIILTALFASIFTLGSSYFLMSTQLKKEQKYWSERMTRERAQELVDRQIKLFEQVNSDILQAEVLIKHFKLEAAKFRSELDLLESGLPNSDYPSTNLISVKGLEIHKLLNKLYAELQMVEFYFSETVDTLITPLGTALEKNYSNNLLLNFAFNIESIESVEDYFKYNFDTIAELSKSRVNIIIAMRKEILAYSTIIYTTD